MEYRLISMSERNSMYFLELEAKPFVEQIPMREKVKEKLLNQFSDDSDEAKFMRKNLIPSLMAALPEDDNMMVFDGMNMRPMSKNPRITIYIDPEEMQTLELKLGDVVSMTLRKMKLEKTKTSEKVF